MSLNSHIMATKGLICRKDAHLSLNCKSRGTVLHENENIIELQKLKSEIQARIFYYFLAC